MSSQIVLFQKVGESVSTAKFTKYMIAQGFKQLLQTSDFEQISVGDIAAQCNISRNTFYYHFKDKYDIISWIFYSEITPMIGTDQPADQWADTLLSLCQYMQRNKDFYIKALQIQGQNSFSECLFEFHANLVQKLLLSVGADKVLDHPQVRTLSNFYAFGLTGAVSTWAKNGMKADPEPTIRILEDLLSAEIFEKILTVHQKASQTQSSSSDALT